jgi:hypothetical protein
MSMPTISHHIILIFMMSGWSVAVTGQAERDRDVRHRKAPSGSVGSQNNRPCLGGRARYLVLARCRKHRTPSPVASAGSVRNFRSRQPLNPQLSSVAKLPNARGCPKSGPCRVIEGAGRHRERGAVESTGCPGGKREASLGRPAPMQSVTPAPARGWVSCRLRGLSG